jgi:hypothetical protein
MLTLAGLWMLPQTGVMALFSEFGRVWVFNSVESAFPGAVFTDKEKADAWIAKHKLSGTLTLYPLDVGVYDLFVENGWFKPKKPRHCEPGFIGGFTDAGQDHEHYEDGRYAGDVAKE